MEGEKKSPGKPELDSAGVYLDLSLEDLNYGNLRRCPAGTGDPASREGSKAD